MEWMVVWFCHSPPLESIHAVTLGALPTYHWRQWASIEGQSARLQPPKASLGMAYGAESALRRIPGNCLPCKISILKGVLPLGGGSTLGPKGLVIISCYKQWRFQDQLCGTEEVHTRVHTCKQPCFPSKACMKHECRLRFTSAATHEICLSTSRWISDQL
jgi:hypothetical protein